LRRLSELGLMRWLGLRVMRKKPGKELPVKVSDTTMPGREQMLVTK
jgi:hypothetical protein